MQNFYHYFYCIEKYLVFRLAAKLPIQKTLSVRPSIITERLLLLGALFILWLCRLKPSRLLLSKREDAGLFRYN